MSDSKKETNTILELLYVLAISSSSEQTTGVISPPAMFLPTRNAFLFFLHLCTCFNSFSYSTAIYSQIPESHRVTSAICCRTTVYKEKLS